MGRVMVRTYGCPVDGCEYSTVSIQHLGEHVEEEHAGTVAGNASPDS